MKGLAFKEPASRYFTTEGFKLHYVEWGDPSHDTLILVHRIRDQSRSWDFFVAALSRQASRPLHIVGLDLRGHGDSGWSPPDRGYRQEDFLLTFYSPPDVAYEISGLISERVTRQHGGRPGIQQFKEKSYQPGLGAYKWEK